MGKPIPERIANKPVLNPGLNLYLDAFFDLQHDKNEANKVPWTVIIKYAEIYEFSNIQTDYLIYFIRSLNNVYSKWINKKKV